MRDIGARDARLLEQMFDGGRYDLGVAFVADPALFPAIVEFLAFAAEVIDEVERQLMAAEKFRDDIVRAQRQRRARIAVSQFL